MNSTATDPIGAILPVLIVGSGCVFLVLAAIYVFILSKVPETKEETSQSLSDVREVISPGPRVVSLDESTYPGGHLTVLFGSESGTAISFAKQIEREGKQNGFKVRVVDLNDVGENIKFLLAEEYRDNGNNARAIFIMSTYGEGAPTENAKLFVDALSFKAGYENKAIYEFDAEDSAEEKKSEENDSKLLKGLNYAVFGLGDRGYPHYNTAGKFVDWALSKVGSERITDLGLGNSGGDLEGDFETWKDNHLWPSLKQRYIDSSRATEGKDTSDLEIPDCHYDVEYLQKSDAIVEADRVSPNDVPASAKHYFTAVDCPVTASRELRSSGSGSTLHTEIDISKSKDLTKYKTADNLCVLPVNDQKVVEALANALSFDLDSVFRIKAAYGYEDNYSVPFPTPCTVRECLSRYCDLTIAPGRSNLKQLATYAKDPSDRSALLRMSSKEDRTEYYEKIVHARVGFAAIILKLFRSIKLPLEHFIWLCPRLRPRYYTISSSSSLHPDTIHITVSIVREELKNGSFYCGVCSNHLARAAKNGMVRVTCKDSTFRLPSNVSKE
mmetsp:Transcript_16660/g.24238  ORF Transcript_16660/g.24238 Transcript_16660/m.24238 type:complete len:555 (+) Transcript_16660:238-1902(+)